jgi:hypothetical protein
VALLAATFVGLIFFFPETMWHRAHPKELANQEKVRPASHEKSAVHGIENVDPESPPEGNLGNGTVDELSLPTLTGVDLYLGKGSPSKKQFLPYTPNKNPIKALAWDFWIPWRLFAFPIVEFAAFVVSWSASSFLTINLTQSQNFAAPPYNFSSQNIGFMNFALLIGAFIGLLTNGRLSDWIAARATRKNRGIREPEMRLPTLIPYVIIMLIGNFVVAFGYEHKWDWKVRSLSLFIITCPISDTSTCTADRHHWIHLRWYPSCRYSRNRVDLRH